MDMGFGTWNVRSLYMGLNTVASELAKYTLGSSGSTGGQPADDYTFLYGDGNANHH
jgi:hypothetical protein